MAGLNLSVDEELSSSFEPCLKIEEWFTFSEKEFENKRKQ